MIGEANARRLATVDPVLGAAFLEVSQKFAAQFYGCLLGVAQGYRAPGDQAAANAAGKSKANGVTSFSYHQTFPSQALDFSVLDPTLPAGNQYVTDGADARYRWVGQLFESMGFEWGGSWSDPDWDHVNIAGGDPPDAHTVRLAAADYQEAVAADPSLSV